jgi:hypothetical protein
MGIRWLGWDQVVALNYPWIPGKVLRQSKVVKDLVKGIHSSSTPGGKQVSGGESWASHIINPSTLQFAEGSRIDLGEARRWMSRPQTRRTSFSTNSLPTGQCHPSVTSEISTSSTLIINGWGLADPRRSTPGHRSRKQARLVA